MNKNKQRKAFIKKYGRCCSTCDSDPVNHGQRDSCQLEPNCNEDNNYPYYREASRIYSIDVNYFC